MDRRKAGIRLTIVASLLTSVLAGVATAVQAETVYVVNNNAASSQGNENVAITPNKKYVLVVGSNTSVQSIRSLPINANGTIGSAVSPNLSFQTSGAVTGLGLSKPVASSIAVHPTAGYAIATIREENVVTDTEKLGGALFLNVNPDTGVLSIARNTKLNLGRYAEAIAIAPNGNYAVVPNKDPGAGVGQNSRGGTISVLDLTKPINSVTERTLAVTGVPSANTSDSTDPAPENVAISPDSSRAYVTLTDNSALTIISNPSAATPSLTTVALPKQPCPPSNPGCTRIQLHADGIAVTPDGKYLVTANKGRGTVRPDSVSIMSPTATSISLVADSGTAIADKATALGITRPSRGFEPESVEIAQVGADLKAFVTLSAVNVVAVFKLNPTATNTSDRLVLEDLVRLDTPASGSSGTNPKGIDVVNTYGNQTLAITANKGTSRNLSAITANGNNPTVGFSSETFSASEDSGQAQITVTLSNSSYQEVRVNYSTSNGTGVSGVDYNPATGTLVFAPGETSKTFSVELINNILPNPGADKTINLLLDSPVNASISDNTSTLNISDDETAVIQFNAPTYTVNENGTNVTVRVTRSGGLGQAVTVQFATSDGSATAGSDYTAVSQSLEFGASDTFKDVTIAIANDALVDPNETVNLTLSNPSNGARLGTQATAVLTIADDEALPVASFAAASFRAKESDGAAVITVNLSGPSTQPVTVGYTTGDNTAIAGSDYVATSGSLTFAPGETSKTFSVPLLRDSDVEGNESVTLTLTDATGATIASASTAELTIENSASLGGKVYLPITRK